MTPFFLLYMYSTHIRPSKKKNTSSRPRPLPFSRPPRYIYFEVWWETFLKPFLYMYLPISIVKIVFLFYANDNKFNVNKHETNLDSISCKMRTSLLKMYLDVHILPVSMHCLFNLHPWGLVLLKVTSRGKFHTNTCLPSWLFLHTCEMPSSRP